MPSIARLRQPQQPHPPAARGLPAAPPLRRLHRPSRLPTVVATTATRRLLDHLRWLLVGR